MYVPQRRCSRQIKERAQEQDIIIKAAAVADYRPKHIRGSKMKKTEDGSDLTLELERTDDILAYLGAHKKQGSFMRVCNGNGRLDCKCKKKTGKEAA